MAIRAARDRFYIGMHESEARNLVVKALSDAGLKDIWSITLFGGEKIIDQRQDY